MSVLDRLPPVLQPRAVDDGGGPGRRAAELAVLLVLGLLLAAATVDDVVHQVRVDERIAVDKTTWIAYTHHPLKKIFIKTGVGTTTDVGCAPPATGASYRLCLILSGPSSPRRMVRGGYRLPLIGDNRFGRRYACFGSALGDGLCGASGPTS
jgi:hypothetical protein